MNHLDCVIAKNVYGNYAVPSSTATTEALAICILAGGVHEPETIQCILDNRRDGVVVHAGTYFGDFLPAISGKGHRVYAFEPGLESYRCAKMTLDLNFLENGHDTKLYNFGLGERVESGLQLLTLREGTEGEGGASRIMQNPDGVEPYRLQSIGVATIDLMVSNKEKEEVTVIQLDVEGYEEKALKGAVKTLVASKPLLILEMANDILFDTEFFNDFIFGELGYKHEERVSRNYVLRSTK